MGWTTRKRRFHRFLFLNTVSPVPVLQDSDGKPALEKGRTPLPRPQPKPHGARLRFRRPRREVTPRVVSCYHYHRHTGVTSTANIAVEVAAVEAAGAAAATAICP